MFPLEEKHSCIPGYISVRAKHSPSHTKNYVLILSLEIKNLEKCLFLLIAQSNRKPCNATGYDTGAK